MKVTKSTGNEMAGGSLTSKMEDCMRENGDRIKCMALEGYTTSQASWHMKDNGSWTSFKG